MTTHIGQIADAVAAELSAGTFSRPLTATRHYRPPEYDLRKGDLVELAVSVVGRSVEHGAHDRAHRYRDFEIEVGVHQRMSDAATADDLLALTDELASYLDRRTLTAEPDARWLSTRQQTVIDADYARELNVFAALFTVTYRLID